MPKKQSKLPKTTVERLSYYFQALEDLMRRGINTVSSESLGSWLNIKSSQIRKDLSYFGDFGKRGMGYDVKYLLKELRYILGIDKKWSMVIVGAGNLGAALAHYTGFEKRGFVIKGIFDVADSKIGTKIEEYKVRSINALPDFIKENDIEIAIIAVPKNSAQMVANTLCESGIKAILNFAPCAISVKNGIRYLTVDLTTKLETLTYYMSFSKDKLWKAFGANQ